MGNDGNTGFSRYQELNKLSKHQLAQMHVTRGGLMGLSTYLKWTKDEIIAEIMYHESGPSVRPAAHDHSWAEDISEVQALCPDHNPAIPDGIRCPGDPADAS